MNWNKLLVIFKHLSIWILAILFLRNSSLTWGWAVSSKYDTLIPQLYGAATNAVVFYFTSFYLIPRFFNTHRKREFYAYSTLFLMAISLVEMQADQYVGALYQNRAYLETKGLTWPERLLEGMIYILPINLFYYIIAFVYRIPFDRQQQHEREQQLQREKLEAELKFLKAQIHPHTLFNGLNSVYHLIDFDPPRAKGLVWNLSNALRYQLYESSERFVPLEKEIAYLRQYIALQEVRVDEDAVVEVSFSGEEEGEWLIAPLLFTPFIENAFKYISHHPAKEDNKITVRLEMEGKRLFFECVNTVDANAPRISEVGGIGLENVRSRLQLLYGVDYQLALKNGPGRFEAKLSLPLKAL
ncbi:MAG: histidine kinase [Lewinellaceae bacterium]|nr:histidine kinase [Phaeodactylibacter sp.]MCB9036645.1 histidine kinase [Lewinellaceae bacterium]